MTRFASRLVPILALGFVIGGSTALKVSCPDSTQPTATNPSSNATFSASATSSGSSGSASTSDATDVTPEVFAYNSVDFGGGDQPVLWGTEIQFCSSFNCAAGSSFTWSGYEKIDTNKSLYLSIFADEDCQGEDLGPWLISANEFPANLTVQQTRSLLVWEGEPTWTSKDYLCYDK